MDIDRIPGAVNLQGVTDQAAAERSSKRTVLAGALDKEDKKLLEACQEFESFFVYMLLKEMRKTVPETKFMHGGRAEEIFRDMMDEETSKDIAKSGNGGLGIASMMYEQLKRPTSM